MRFDQNKCKGKSKTPSKITDPIYYACKKLGHIKCESLLLKNLNLKDKMEVKE